MAPPKRKHYCFEVRLLEVKPAPWRRFLIEDSASFLDLHEAIQVACGWEDGHLFAFSPARRAPPIAGVPDEDSIEVMPDAALVSLRSYFGMAKRTACFYEYDFGDSWWHRIKLTGVHDAEPGVRRRLVAGRLAFPPEDCGGPSGYQRCVAVARGEPDPRGDHEFREWLGDWKPDAFDLETARDRFDA